MLWCPVTMAYLQPVQGSFKGTNIFNIFHIEVDHSSPATFIQTRLFCSCHFHDSKEIRNKKYFLFSIYFLLSWNCIHEHYAWAGFWFHAPETITNQLGRAEPWPRHELSHSGGVSGSVSSSPTKCLMTCINL